MIALNITPLLKILPKKKIWPATIALLALVAVLLLAFLYASYSRWMQTRETIAQMTQQAANEVLITQALTELRKEFERQASPLQLHATDAGDVSMHLMRQMNRLGMQHGLKLGNVSPAPGRPFLALQEYPMSVEIRGNYSSLAMWLQALEQDAPHLAYSQLGFRESEAPGEVLLNVSLVAYQQGEKP